jgi:hypothetical protein
MVLLAGCGRIAFDPLTEDGSGTPGAPCPSQPAADTVTISGTTFRYTSFTNAKSPVDLTVVTATRFGGGNLAMATSDVDGSYSMSATIGGVATPAYITYNRTSYLPTRTFLDAPLAGDLVGTGAILWAPGDGPVWNATQMDMLYTAASVTRVGTSGAINVGVRDCANNPIAGVQVTFDPPPGAVVYQDDTGMPNNQLTATGATYGHVLALNPAFASTHITAMKDGYTFTTATFTVSDGTNNLVLLHGAP